jgi:hypothetical protein
MNAPAMTTAGSGPYFERSLPTVIKKWMSCTAKWKRLEAFGLQAFVDSNRL